MGGGLGVSNERKTIGRKESYGRGTKEPERRTAGRERGKNREPSGRHENGGGRGGDGRVFDHGLHRGRASGGRS